jgi:hypothetical protein
MYSTRFLLALLFFTGLTHAAPLPNPKLGTIYSHEFSAEYSPKQVDFLNSEAIYKRQKQLNFFIERTAVSKRDGNSEAGADKTDATPEPEADEFCGDKEEEHGHDGEGDGEGEHGHDGEGDGGDEGNNRGLKKTNGNNNNAGKTINNAVKTTNNSNTNNNAEGMANIVNVILSSLYSGNNQNAKAAAAAAASTNNNNIVNASPATDPNSVSVPPARSAIAAAIADVVFQKAQASASTTKQ